MSVPAWLNNPWVVGIGVAILTVPIVWKMESCKPQVPTPPIAKFQIITYGNQASDQKQAKRIYNELVKNDDKELAISWEKVPIATVKPPELDSIYCTPNSARYVKPLVLLLRKRNFVRIDSIHPSRNQQSNLLILAHNINTTDDTEVDNKELDNAQALCTKKP